MSVSPKKRYGELSWGEAVTLPIIVLLLPLLIVWNLATSPFVDRNRSKGIKRVILDSAVRFTTSSLSVSQLQYLLGTSRAVYEAWVKRNKLPAIIEELGEDSRLFWIGPKRTDRVILCFHGGAYMIGLQDYTASFWRHVQLQLEKENKDVGLAILNYSLVPNGPFPIQLRQARLAVEHLLSSGVAPQSIQIVGDSAGGGLVFQLVSHILHPLDSVPPLVLSAPLRGCYLMSPWVSLTHDTGSHQENSKSDIISSKTIGKWGESVLIDVPESQNVYIEASKASGEWFKGIDSVVDHVLVTVGELECLRDDVIEFTDLLKRHHRDVEIVLQSKGVHNEPYNDFVANKPGNLVPFITAWLATGFKT